MILGHWSLVQYNIVIDAVLLQRVYSLIPTRVYSLIPTRVLQIQSIFHIIVTSSSLTYQSWSLRLELNRGWIEAFGAEWIFPEI